MNIKISIRPFTDADATETAAMVKDVLLTVNIKDYGKTLMLKTAAEHDARHLREMAHYTDFYVAVNESNKIVGCGGISNYWDVPQEAIILTGFVDRHQQHAGIGHQIMAQLMRDPVFLRSKRIEIPAAVSAVPFYQQFGFNYKNGHSKPDDEGHIRLELHRTVTQ